MHRSKSASHNAAPAASGMACKASHNANAGAPGTTATPNDAMQGRSAPSRGTGFGFGPYTRNNGAPRAKRTHCTM